MGLSGALDAAFVAYPHEAAAPTVGGCARAGERRRPLRDFRLPGSPTYERWYGAA